jgi:hypothetical protein
MVGRFQSEMETRRIECPARAPRQNRAPAMIIAKAGEKPVFTTRAKPLASAFLDGDAMTESQYIAELTERRFEHFVASARWE